MNHLTSLTATLQTLWRQAGYEGPQRLALLMTLGGALGLLLTLPVQNPLLHVIGAACGAWGPIDWLQARRRRRQRQLDLAIAELLPALAVLVRSLRQPLPALTELAPRSPKLLRAPLQKVLATCGSGVPLPTALTRMAESLGDPFYLHQLAALVGLHLGQGGDLAGSLERLAHRLQAQLELRAETAVEVQGYCTLILVMALATFLPALYWALTRSAQWELLRQGTGAWLLTWAVGTSLLIYRLPRWLARYL